MVPADSSNGRSKPSKPSSHLGLKIDTTFGENNNTRGQRHGPLLSPRAYNVAKHTTSSMKKYFRPAPLKLHQSQTKEASSPVTPSIVVTPARSDDDEELNRSDSVNTRTRPRPASSVYSRATYISSNYPESEAPPVPSLPKFLANAFSKPTIKHVELQLPSRSAPPVSAFSDATTPGTAFEEDEDYHRKKRSTFGLPSGPRGQAYSRGWWDFITSPFLARNPSRIQRATIAETEEPDSSLVSSAAPFAGSHLTATREESDGPLTSTQVTQPPLPWTSLRQRSQTWSGAAPGTLKPTSEEEFGVPANPWPQTIDDKDQDSPVFHYHSALEDGDEKWLSMAERDIPIGLDHSPSVSQQQNSTHRSSVHDTRAYDSQTNPYELSPALPDSDSERAGTPSPLAVRHPSQLGPETVEQPGPAHQPCFWSPLESGNSANASAHQSSYATVHTTCEGPLTPLDARPRETEVTQTAAEPFGQLFPAPTYPTPAVMRDPHIERSQVGQEQFVSNEQGRGRSNRPYRHASTHWGIPSLPKDRETRIWGAAFLGSLLILLLIVLLVMFIPRHSASTPIEAQWLNLTGYPPLPTGVSTVAQPKNNQEAAGCVQDEAAWTCSVPAASISSPLPNFRLEIIFNNGTVPVNNTLTKRSAVSASGRWRLLKALKARSDELTPYPAIPSEADQLFLGNSTDHNEAPYDGEATPFTISFLNPEPLQQHASVATSTSTSTHYLTSTVTQSSPNAQPTSTTTQTSTVNQGTATREAIPAPTVNHDGTPAAAQLYPLAISQPLRLFNRGQPDEYFGFYTYFDRSLFVNSPFMLNASTTSSDAENSDGVIAQSNSSFPYRCTWSQTRFLVQIWTMQGGNATGSLPLLAPPANQTLNPNMTGPGGSSTLPAAESTANDLVQPGSFPYPVTITLDRHGGDPSLKNVYCYGIDSNGKLNRTDATFLTEDRGAGGTLVNPALSPSSNGTLVMVPRSDKAVQPEGIDGGSGGCGCTWQNFGN